jgi:predicted PurR-regulated permease PerM
MPGAEPATETSSVKIQQPFRLGLIAGLGVLTAILIAGAISNLTTILTYVGAALFLALGLDPLVSWLERHKIKRPIAILITLVAVLGIFAGLILALIPVIVEQVSNATEQITNNVIPGFQDGSTLAWIEDSLSFLDVDTRTSITDSVQSFFTDNLGNIGTILVQSSVSVASGLFGAVIVLILMVYFVSSLGSIKRGMYQLIPASKRPKFIDIAEQISQSVGRYVMGQVTLALVNGVLSIIVLSVLGVKYSALFAFIAFLGSLIPLVGTLSASVIIILSTFLFTDLPSNPVTIWHTIVVAVYYIVYMQVEAYLLNPRIMARAVKVPGVIVVIAALTGGTLLGVLGALIAIPVAASILLIVRQVLVPRQSEL